MSNKKYFKEESSKAMQNYMDFNGLDSVGDTAGYIKNQQHKNMENYMDFNGPIDKKTQKYIGAGLLIAAGILFIYIIKKK